MGGSCSLKKRQQCDALLVVILLLIVGAGWCTAQAKWTPEAWALPTQYLDPLYSDFIGASAYFKSLNDEGFLPFGWKPVSTFAAPSSGGWDGFPTPDEMLLGFFALLFRLFGVFAGTNLGVLVGHLMAAATFYLVARRGYSIATPWAFLGGLTYGLAPYQFAQQPHHVSCQYIWYLPLFPLVWRWVVAEQGLSAGSRRLWWAGSIGFVTGLQNTYYANIFCQLVLACGLVRSWQTRAWAALKPAALVIGAVGTAFLLSNLDTITYRLSHSPGSDSGDAAPLISQREYKWMDIYGFKLVDLFIPPVTHHSSEFAVFGRNHRAASVLNDEEGSGYLGLLGIGCLLFLTGVAVRALVDGRADDVPLEAWWVLWVVIMFTTGGLNAIIAAFTGFTLFRTAIRYSIVVLLLALLYAGRRLTGWQQRAVTRLGSGRVQAITLAATLASTALVLWDQLPRSPTTDQQAVIATAVDSDWAFVVAMEAAVPVAADGKKPMVFQLPVLGGPRRPTIPSSHHARPYLYSHTLHYSSGASGDTLRWQLEVERQLFRGAERDPQGGATVLSEANARRAIEMLQDKGFDAVYVNRAGYAGRAVGLEAMLSQLGFTASIESRQGDLVCVPLR